jgi:hypothetical protein
MKRATVHERKRPVRAYVNIGNFKRRGGSIAGRSLRGLGKYDGGENCEKYYACECSPHNSNLL